MGAQPSVAVIGGGLSGLWLATELLDRGFKVDVFERSWRVGGRVHTLGAFECGAFRVHPTHKRLLKLANALGVELASFPLQTERIGFSSPESSPLVSSAEPGLTWWDLRALRDGIHAADVADAETGYRASTDVHAATAMDVLHKDDKDEQWLYATNGFVEIVEKLNARLPTGCVHLKCLVRNVSKQTDGRFQVERSSEDGTTTATSFDFVVFACPPNQTGDFDLFREYGKSMVMAVDPSPLMRIYAKSHVLAKRVRGKRVVSCTLLQQTIGVPPFQSKNDDDEDWVQVSYSEGQVARFWENLRLSKPDAVVPTLTKQLNAVFGTETPWNLVDVQMLFWEQAVHKWKPIVDTWPASARVLVNAAKCPGAFVCGEALSTQQTWMEGALETAELVLNELSNSVTAISTTSLKTFRSLDAIPKEPLEPWIVVHGRVLRVDSWAAVHPGGRSAIDAHVFTDATALWDVIHGSLSLPWRTLGALQIGWLLR